MQLLEKGADMGKMKYKEREEIYTENVKHFQGSGLKIQNPFQK